MPLCLWHLALLPVLMRDTQCVSRIECVGALTCISVLAHVSDNMKEIYVLILSKSIALFGCIS